VRRAPTPPGVGSPTAAEAAFSKDVRPPIKPPAARAQARRTGRQDAEAPEGAVFNATVQFGGEKLLPCSKGADNDRAWFASHVGRDYRIRPPIGRERKLKPRTPRGWRRWIVTKQVAPGARIRLSFFALADDPPWNAEGIARQIFEGTAETHAGIIGQLAAKMRERPCP
jgi:hypothetical protein